MHKHLQNSTKSTNVYYKKTINELQYVNHNFRTQTLQIFLTIPNNMVLHTSHTLTCHPVFGKGNINSFLGSVIYHFLLRDFSPCCWFPNVSNFICSTSWGKLGILKSFFFAYIFLLQLLLSFPWNQICSSEVTKDKQNTECYYLNNLRMSCAKLLWVVSYLVCHLAEQMLYFMSRVPTPDFIELYIQKRWFIIIIIIIIIIISFTWRVFIHIFLRQTMCLGNTVLQLFYHYYLWCLYG